MKTLLLLTLFLTNLALIKAPNHENKIQIEKARKSMSKRRLAHKSMSKSNLAPGSIRKIQYTYQLYLLIHSLPIEKQAELILETVFPATITLKHDFNYPEARFLQWISSSKYIRTFRYMSKVLETSNFIKLVKKLDHKNLQETDELFSSEEAAKILFQNRDLTQSYLDDFGLTKDYIDTFAISTLEGIKCYENKTHRRWMDDIWPFVEILKTAGKSKAIIREWILKQPSPFWEVFCLQIMQEIGADSRESIEWLMNGQPYCSPYWFSAVTPMLKFFDDHDLKQERIIYLEKLKQCEHEQTSGCSSLCKKLKEILLNDNNLERFTKHNFNSYEKFKSYLTANSERLA